MTGEPIPPFRGKAILGESGAFYICQPDIVNWIEELEFCIVMNEIDADPIKLLGLVRRQLGTTVAVLDELAGRGGAVEEDGVDT